MPFCCGTKFRFLPLREGKASVMYERPTQKADSPEAAESADGTRFAASAPSAPKPAPATSLPAAPAAASLETALETALEIAAGTKASPGALTQEIAATLSNLPKGPGVYIHKDLRQQMLYIGKATSLRQRVRSYFQPSADHPPRIRALIQNVHSIEILQTHTEAEALILEANLIKKHRPRYNIQHKDDKSYPFFKLTVHEHYPRLYLTREKRTRDAEYYGPYPSVRDARATLNTIRRHFPLRTSKMVLDGSRVFRPCLNFQLGRCLAPCRGTVSVTQYDHIVQQIRLFLQGRDQELISRLETTMQTHAEGQRYEEAARARDAIQAVRHTLARQQVLLPNGLRDQDVFALARESHYAGVGMLFVRRGRLLGSDFMWLERNEDITDGRILRSVLNRIYTRPEMILPHEILIPCAFEDQEILAQWLSEQKGSRVRIRVMPRGGGRRLVELAQRNAQQGLRERLSGHIDEQALLEEVQRTLRLRFLPTRVEAFDNSTFQGAESVASMVVWEGNAACRQEYRRYHIRSAQGVGHPDDFQAMLEVITRRYRRVLVEQRSLPSLILIDGGKGQVNAAQRGLEELGVDPLRVDLIGLAKGRSERRRGRRRVEIDEEYVVKPELKQAIRLPRNSAPLYFLQRIRDEAHRFALAFHRQERRKRTLRSSLSSIPGVGPKRAERLLQHLGSFAGVRTASLEALRETPGFSAGLAQQVFDHLRDLDEG